MNKQEITNYQKAGQIAKQTKEFARQIIKPEMPLVEIAEKIENKIKELKGELAFPVNLCTDETAAHYSPTSTDETKATGLLKIDIGVHINGAIADTAFSIDLTPDKQHKKLIQASEQALENAIKSIKQNKNITLSEIGKSIQETITSFNFSPIRNLSGHQLGNFLVHAGITIPNYENNNQTPLAEGAYAIEPFATTGTGIVQDGALSTIYRFEKTAPIRDALARKILQHILEKYQTLPFSQKAIEKEFASRARLSLRLMEQAGILHHYPQLIEKSKSPVSQAEHTLLITKDKVEVVT